MLDLLHEVAEDEPTAAGLASGGGDLGRGGMQVTVLDRPLGDGEVVDQERAAVGEGDDLGSVRSTLPEKATEPTR